MNSEPEISPPTPEPTPSGPRLNGLLLLTCLLAPALITCLAAVADKSSRGPAPAVALIGAALGGIGCGILLGRRFGHTPATKIFLGVLFAAVGGVAALTAATFGCLASGYNLNFH